MWRILKFYLPERLATPLAFSLSSTWHFFLAILCRIDAFSRNLPAKRKRKEKTQHWSNSDRSATYRSIHKAFRPRPSQRSFVVTFDLRWVAFQKHRTNRVAALHKTAVATTHSQYDIAYHILMILQCPGPWRRRSRANLLWKDLPSGAQIKSWSCSVLISDQKVTRDARG